MSSSNFHTNSYISAKAHHNNPYNAWVPLVQLAREDLAHSHRET